MRARFLGRRHRVLGAPAGPSCQCSAPAVPLRRTERGLVRMCGEQAGCGALFGSTLPLPSGLSHFLWLLQVLSHRLEESPVREGLPRQPVPSEALGSAAVFPQWRRFVSWLFKTSRTIAVLQRRQEHTHESLSLGVPTEARRYQSFSTRLPSPSRAKHKAAGFLGF